MRFVKLALLSVLVFGGLFFLMGLLLPSKVRISKAVNLSVADTVVLEQVRNTAQWPRWHPAFSGAVPAGQQLLLRRSNDSLVEVDIMHRSGNTVRNGWALHRFGAADSVTLQWYMDFRLSPLPWHRFSSLFYEGTYGRMMETGLQNLKSTGQRR